MLSKSVITHEVTTPVAMLRNDINKVLAHRHHPWHETEKCVPRPVQRRLRRQWLLPETTSAKRRADRYVEVMPALSGPCCVHTTSVLNVCGMTCKHVSTPLPRFVVQDRQNVEARRRRQVYCCTFLDQLLIVLSVLAHLSTYAPMDNWQCKLVLNSANDRYRLWHTHDLESLGRILCCGEV